jgi:hypothetical protein
MAGWNEYVAHYIGRLRGLENEDAYHRLHEADHAVVPILMGAFRTEQDPGIRAVLVDIVWQHRLPETAGFLAEALADPDPEVWKNALDGFVTLGPSAIPTLQSVRNRIQLTTAAEHTRAEWIDEALDQMKELEGRTGLSSPGSSRAKHPGNR